MNIDDYRALKAEMEKESTEPEVTEEVQPEATPPVVDETKNTPEEPSNEDLKEEDKPKSETIEIDGQELTIDELKSGYLRQSDYTRKTQEIQREKKAVEEAMQFMEKVQSNPQVAEQLSQQLGMPNLDPNQARYQELENRYYDLLIESQIRDLKSKYGDFDVQAVLETARDSNINDLDTAYHVVQSRKGISEPHDEPDMDQIKEELRKELMKEIRSEMETNVDTSTVITQGGGQAPVRDTGPQLSAVEANVARNMGLTPEEYAKWRDAK